MEKLEDGENTTIKPQNRKEFRMVNITFFKMKIPFHEWIEESLKFILCHKIATLNLQYYKFGYLIDLQFFLQQ